MEDSQEVIRRAQKLFEESLLAEQQKHLCVLQDIGSALAVAQNIEQANELQDRLAAETQAFQTKVEAARREFAEKLEGFVAISTEYERQTAMLLPSVQEQVEEVEVIQVNEATVVELPALPVLAAVKPVRTVADDLADEATPPALVEQINTAIATVYEVLPTFYHLTTLSANELFGLRNHLSKRQTDTSKQKLEWMLPHLMNIRETPAMWFNLDGNQQDLVKRAISLEKRLDDPDDDLTLRRDRLDRLAKLILKAYSSELNAQSWNWVIGNGEFRGVNLRTYFTDAAVPRDAFTIFIAEDYITKQVRGPRLPIQIQNVVKVMREIRTHYYQLKRRYPAETIEPLKLDSKISFFESLLSFYAENRRLTANQMNTAMSIAVDYISVIKGILEFMEDVLPSNVKLLSAGGE